MMIAYVSFNELHARCDGVQFNMCYLVLGTVKPQRSVVVVF